MDLENKNDFEWVIIEISEWFEIDSKLLKKIIARV